MIQRLFLSMCVLAPLLLSLAKPAAAADRPNVVLIMTDDQGIGDFGVNGNPVIRTPNIDALAGRSASLSTFYVQPVCSPTRACLMTGRYNYRTRCIDTYLGRSLMDTEEVTVAELLHQAGYATGIFGKWHLGDNYPLRPIDQGFDEALVHRGGGLAQPSEPLENERRYTDAILFHNGKQVQSKGYCTDVYFDAALDFIDDSHEAGKSFFAYIPTNAPHGPFHDVPEKLLKEYQQANMEQLIVGKRAGKRAAGEVDQLARIAAMITNIDQNVGRLQAKLEKLGLAENTVVIVMVDNGPNTQRYVGELRGRKGEVHDGGIRSPFWVQWPARLKAGTTSSDPGAHIDVLPTILDACQVPVPDDLQLDGRSLLPLLEGKLQQLPERYFVVQSHRGDQPVRYNHFMIRDRQYKLLHPSGFGTESLTGEPKFELYDLLADPGEKQNLIAEKPQVAARLKQAYDKWFDDVSSTRPDNYAPPRIAIGTEHENPTVLTRQDWRGGTWAADSIGHWLLDAKTGGKYDIRLVMNPSRQDETAELRIGPHRLTAKVAAGDKECLFEDVDLKQGELKLEAVLTAGDKHRGVYQVEVEQ